MYSRGAFTSGGSTFLLCEKATGYGKLAMMRCPCPNGRCAGDTQHRCRQMVRGLMVAAYREREVSSLDHQYKIGGQARIVDVGRHTEEEGAVNACRMSSVLPLLYDKTQSFFVNDIKCYINHARRASPASTREGNTSRFLCTSVSPFSYVAKRLGERETYILIPLLSRLQRVAS